MTAPDARERDPRFRKILEGLAGHLDPQLFQTCVEELLQEDFPGLAGVHGGSDAGMDGAIPDGEGSPFTLVVTIRDDVIGNLTQSLKARLAAGDTRRKAVLATSQALSPRRRSNLERRAEKLGFVLVQTFDRRDIASRLSRNSRWTKMLLGITGDPPALSTFPRTRRTLPEVELVGRDADLTWLRVASEDRLIVGEPGSGKTSLLLAMVREERGLFLATDDEGLFADSYREQRPAMVLVDDAHLDPERLERLRQIRRDMKAEGDFAIVATSWKGAWREVSEALGGLPDERVRHLELLTPAEILEVLRRIGVQAPEDEPYLAELVSQAAGRPGLAVTLGTLSLQGSYREVLTGQALYRSLVPTLRRILGQDPTQLLAAFALGGRRGMGLAAVAEFLESGIGEVWDTAARIGASGVLSERGKDEAGEAVLAVNPATLRVALLHEVFFSPAGRAWEPLLRQAQSFPSALEILVLAANRQVPVPRGELQRLILEVDSPEAWEGFAALGEAEAVWVLEHYPGPTADIAAQVLENAPERAIRRLLKEAEEAVDSTDLQARKPLQTLRTWIEAIPTGPDWLTESLRRRRHLVEAAAERLEQGGDSGVVLRAAFLALSPRLESTRMTATGGGVILRQGSVPASAAAEMLKLWERVRGAMPDLELETWRELGNALHWWLYPNIASKDGGEDELEPFYRGARQILTDLVPYADGRPGLTSALLERADDVALHLDLDVDPDFETLYPRSPRISRKLDLKPVREARQRAVEAARSFGRSWAERAPESVLDDLDHYAQEAKWTRGSLGTRPEFEEALVQSAERPEQWVGAFLQKRGHPSLLSAFLYRVVEERRPGWEEFLVSSLRIREYAWDASIKVLRLAEPPEELLKLALERVEPQLVETACLQGKVPTATLRRLLAHEDPRIAVAAAIGEWLAEPRQSVSTEVQQAWRDVVLRIPDDGLRDLPDEELWFQEILSHDPNLAFDWLCVQLAVDLADHPLRIHEGGPASAALRALDSSHRAQLLQELPPDRSSESLVSHLVSGSPDLYRQLLSRSGLQWHHYLAPLAGTPPDTRWIALARLALEAGHDAREIAEVSFHSLEVFSPSVEYYSRWETAFRKLSTVDDPALQEVAQHGLREAERLVSEERVAERRFALTGQL